MVAQAPSKPSVVIISWIVLQTCGKLFSRLHSASVEELSIIRLRSYELIDSKAKSEAFVGE